MTFSSYRSTLREFRRFIEDEGLDLRLRRVTAPRTGDLWKRGPHRRPARRRSLPRAAGAKVEVWGPHVGHTPPVEVPEKTAQRLRAYGVATGRLASSSAVTQPMRAKIRTTSHP